MRILFIHNHYQQFGGEDTIVELEKEALEQHGASVTVYSRHNDEIKSFHTGGKALLPLSAIHSRKTTYDIRAAIDACRPDVAYLHNIYPLISPSIYPALAEARIPSFQVAHNFRPFCSNGLLYTKGAICEECLGHSTLPAVSNRCFHNSLAMSAMYAAATARAQKLSTALKGFICPTPFTASKLMVAGLPPDRLFTRPHFIPGDAGTPKYGDGRYALFIGRLSPEKGLNTLVDAFAGAPSVELVIAGTGPMEEDLRLRIAALRASNIHLAGFVKGDAKRRLLENAMFVVVPSECYEAFGMIVLEGFLAGKPALASRIGGLPYVVADGQTGRLFEPGDAIALAECAMSLAADVAGRAEMGRAARFQVESEFGPERWFERTMEIFRSEPTAAVSQRSVVDVQAVQ